MEKVIRILDNDNMAGLREVKITKQISYENYDSLTPKEIKELKKLSHKMKGVSVVHINTASLGGGVAELLLSQIPLERSLGIKSSWLVLDAPPEFFEITKKIHNLLQGKPGFLSEEEIGIYVSTNKEIGNKLEKFLEKIGRGILVIHDPQPAPLIFHVPDDWRPILRLHIDLSSPNPKMLEFLRKYIDKYHSIVVSVPEYTSPLELEKSRIKIINPAIDPYSEKNQEIKIETAESILESLEINCTKPILTQVSRFDPWKDPLGVIKAYYEAKNEIPDLQLVLAGFLFAVDDPEAFEIFDKVKKHSKGDPDIFVFADPRQLKDTSNDTFINALYTASTVVMQKSLREGFGLTITEAMWKKKAVIAGKTNGTTLQISHGKNGFLVSSIKEAAEKTKDLIKNPKLREKLGKAAKESVRKKFLISRFVRENIETYISCMEIKN